MTKIKSKCDENTSIKDVNSENSIIGLSDDRKEILKENQLDENINKLQNNDPKTLVEKCILFFNWLR